MTRPILLPHPWDLLAEKAGGVAKLAEHFGVDPRTVRRWANGERKVAGPAAIILEGLLRRWKVAS